MQSVGWRHLVLSLFLFFFFFFFLGGGGGGVTINYPSTRRFIRKVFFFSFFTKILLQYKSNYANLTVINARFCNYFISIAKPLKFGEKKKRDE